MVGDGLEAAEGRVLKGIVEANEDEGCGLLKVIGDGLDCVKAVDLAEVRADVRGSLDVLVDFVAVMVEAEEVDRAGVEDAVEGDSVDKEEADNVTDAEVVVLAGEGDNDEEAEEDENDSGDDCSEDKEEVVIW